MQEKSAQKNISRIIFILLTLIVMVIIFMFSSENSDDSSDTSGGITEFIIRIFNRDFSSLSYERQEVLFDLYEHIIRKIAHFTIFMSLGFCSSCAAGKRKIFSLKSLLVLTFCFLYACSDEIHQLFVPGRAGMLKDVFIDTSGSITGMLISLAVIKTMSYIKSKTADGK
mgnify:CR=1 FL=1